MAFSHRQTLKIRAGLSLPSSLISVSDLCPSKDCPLQHTVPNLPNRDKIFDVKKGSVEYCMGSSY